MKKLFTALFVSLSLLQVAQAQSLPAEAELPAAPSFKQNEISVSLPLGTDLQVLAVTGSVLVSFVGTIIKNDIYAVIPIFVPLSVEYSHWTSGKLAFGVCLSTDTVSALPYILASNISLMPEIKYRLFSSGNFHIYSKAAVGLKGLLVGQMNDGRLEFIEGLSSVREQLSFDPSSFNLGTLYSYIVFSPVAWQVSPLCFEVNTAKKDLSFFMEMGTGVQGALNIGLKKMF